MRKLLRFTLPLVAAFTLWEIISRGGFVSPALWPPPSQVLLAWGEMFVTGLLLSDLVSSLWRLLAGLVIGSALGIVFGLLTARIKIFAQIFSPLLQILRPLPPVAIIPLVIIWFGIDNGAKIFSIAWAVFFPVWINTQIGAASIPALWLWSAKLLTASQFKIFYRVIFPAALPFIAAGIRLGVAVGFIMVFVSELAGASSGLGYRISLTHSVYRLDQMIAVLLTLSTLGALTDQLFVFLINRIFPYLKFSSR